MKLREIILVDNPIASTDPGTYKKEVQKRWPSSLQVLDMQEIGAVIKFDLVETESTMPAVKPSYFPSPEVQAMATNFARQYAHAMFPGIAFSPHLHVRTPCTGLAVTSELHLLSASTVVVCSAIVLAV
jgi:hypothetical protein